MRAWTWLVALVFWGACQHAPAVVTSPPAADHQPADAGPPNESPPGGPVPYAVLQGDVDKDDVGMVAALLQAGWPYRHAVLLIDTPGGDAGAAHAIARLFDAAARLHERVDCVVDGQADSAGFYVLQACHHRYMTRRSALATHQPYVEGDVPPEDRFNTSEQLRARGRAFAEHCAARLRVSFAEYWARVSDHKDWWMDWEEALQYGAIDEVVDSAAVVLGER